VRAFSATGGLGGFRGAQDLQVFSLQGENNLEFGARGMLLAAEDRTSSSAAAGVQREPGIWRRRNARWLAQYVHDADIPHARSIPRPDPDRI